MTELVDVPLIYGGEWRSDSSGFNYFAKESDVILVPMDCDYETLRGMVYAQLGVNPCDVSLALKFLITTTAPAVPPIVVDKDSKVQIFLRRCSKGVTPLIVEFEPLLSNIPPSLEGSNMGGFLDKSPIEQLPVVVDNVDGNKDGEEHGDNFIEFDERSGMNHVRDGIDGNDFNIGPPVDVPISGYLPSPNPAMCVTPSVDTTPLSSSSSTVHVNEIFQSKIELKNKMSLIAVNKNFESVTYKSTKTLLVLKCKADGCKWMMRATAIRGCDAFKIVRYNDVHSCSLNVNQDNKSKASSQFVSELIKHKYKNVDMVYKPKEIVSDMQRLFGVNISYHKAWRSREIALAMVRGTPITRKNLGQKRRQRKPPTTPSSEDTIGKVCGLCHQKGHNRRTCQNPLAIPSSSTPDECLVEA